MNDVLSTKLVAIEQDVRSMEERVKAITISNDDDYASASKLVLDIAARTKRIDALRKEFTGPLKDQVKVIDNKFKMQIEPLEKIDTILREKMLAYYEAKERAAREEAAKREAELARINAEIEAKKAEAAEMSAKEKKAADKEVAKLEQSVVALDEPVIAPERTTRLAEGTVSMKKVWDFEVVDITMVPVDLLTVDSARIRKMIDMGDRNIPGINIFQKTSLSARQ